MSEFASANISKGSGGGYNVSYGDDSGLYVEFFEDAILDKKETEKKGRNIYKSVDMVRIAFPGNNTKEVVRVVKTEPSGSVPSDPDRFPKQWAAYQEGHEQVSDGTPLEHWPPLSKAQVLELKSMKIHTVEQLASLPDTNLRWMGARQLRDNAKAWLEEAESGSETIKLRNQVEELQRQIQAMANQNKGFSSSEKKEQVVESSEKEITKSEEVKPIKRKMTKKKG